MKTKITLTILVYTIFLLATFLLYEKFPQKFIDHPVLSVVIGALLPSSISGTINFFMFNKKNNIKTHKTTKSINKFMESFIERGSSICIFSNRLSWLAKQDAQDVYKLIKSKLADSCKVEIIVAVGEKIYNEEELTKLGLQVYRTTKLPNHSVRFTIINADRAGAAEVAMATGTVPNHIIRVYNEKDDRHVIDLAKELTNIAINKRKGRR